MGQKCPLNFLKGTLGVKHTPSDRAVLKECGYEALQFCWFRAANKFYNSMLSCNSNAVCKIVKADCALHARDTSCWTAQLLEALQGLRNGVAMHKQL